MVYLSLQPVLKSDHIYAEIKKILNNSQTLECMFNRISYL